MKSILSLPCKSNTFAKHLWILKHYKVLHSFKFNKMLSMYFTFYSFNIVFYSFMLTAVTQVHPFKVLYCVLLYDCATMYWFVYWWSLCWFPDCALCFVFILILFGFICFCHNEHLCLCQFKHICENFIRLIFVYIFLSLQK